MSIHCKVSGSWRGISDVHVKVSGVWKQCKNVYIKENGVWRPLLSYSVSAALPSLKNDTTVSKTYNNVVVGSVMTLTYNVTNNVYDGSDYAGVGLSGATFDGGGNWKLGPGAGTYVKNCTVTSSTVTISIWGHGLTAASGNVSYISNL